MDLIGSAESIDSLSWLDLNDSICSSSLTGINLTAIDSTGLIISMNSTDLIESESISET